MPYGIVIPKKVRILQTFGSKFGRVKQRLSQWRSSRYGGLTIALAIAFAGVANAQTFEKIPALSFVKPYAGADPLPQTLTVASTGNDFNFSVAASTSSGGSWLQVSPSGSGCCVTPGSITVSVAAPASLVTGTYSGQIVLTHYYGGSPSITVPVTLTVAPGGTAFFDNLPGQISFSLQTNSAPPPPQPMQIRNGGAGALSWTLSLSTADGGQWLMASSSSGTAPSAVTTAINVAALPGGGKVPGTFVGQVTLHEASQTVSIPVSVTVDASVFQQASPLNFTKVYGGDNPLPQTVMINSTDAAFNVSVAAYSSKGGNWLQVSPAGAGCCSTPESITVSANPAISLPAGTYTAEIVVNKYYGHGEAMTIPVTLQIEQDPSTQPYFDNLPGQLSFSLKTGGNAPPTQPIQIRDGGAGTLGWTASLATADGGKWLTISSASGTAPATVSVGVNVAALPGGGLVQGTFTGQVTLQGSGSTGTIPVSVTVGDNVFEQVNAINFTKPYAGANPLPQTLTIASTGSGFNFSVAAFSATGGDWLQVSPVGSGCCATTESITVSANPSISLAAGTYTAEIVFTEYYGHGVAMTVPVTLTVAGATGAYFDNLPGQMAFSLQTGGNTPPTQRLQIRNGGSGTLAWTGSTSTSDGAQWLTLSATSGSAPSLISVGLNKAALPGGGLIQGTFTGQITLHTGGDVETVPVSVTVADTVFRQVNAVNFTKLYAGQNPLPQTLMVASTGSALNFSIGAFTANGGNWLQVSPVGVGCCATNESVTVSVNPAATLAPGDYTGQIVFTEYYGHGVAMTVPVTLTIAPTGSAFIDNVQGQLSFSFPAKSPNPPTQTIKIDNGGTGALSWTSGVTTSDGGNWLTISALTGNAPSAITVGINNAALPGGGQIPGFYTGLVVLRGGVGAVTIPVSVVVGADVFKQLPALTFTKAPGGSNPPSQTVTVASLGTNFNFSSAAYSGTGGNWLQVSPSGVGCCATPRSVTVSVNPAATLAAGTYTGELVFTQYYGHAMAMTVPVYLVVGNPQKIATTTMLVSSANPSSPGQSVTFTATVTGQGSGITGSVTFKNGATTLGTAPLLGGKASIITATLAVGTHSITAGYSGDSTFAASTSPALMQTVLGGGGKPPTTTVLRSSLDPAIAGKPIVLTASVTGTGSGLSGSVTFKDGNATLATIALTNGTASYSATALAPGMHSLTAVYGGNATFATSSSSALAQLILIPTTMTLTSSANPSQLGHFVTFTATVNSSGATPTGYVTFFDGPAPVSSVLLNGRTASLTTSGLAKGTHEIYAVYGGSSADAGSSSSAIAQSIQ